MLEFAKNIILALSVSYLLRHLKITTTGSTIGLALMLWPAFPCVLLISSVMYEKVPRKLAAIHAGDWLIKLVYMSLVLALWRDA